MTELTIDRGAPVVAEAEVLVRAAPADVFAVVTDIPAWPHVYPELRDVVVDGPVAEGVTFRFRTGPGTIDAKVVALGAAERFAIEGRGMGATSRYVFALSPTLGGTRLVAAQSMSGLAVRAARKMLQGIAETSLRDWLEGIKSSVEERRDA